MKNTKKILDESKLEQLVYECAMTYIKSTPELRKKLLEKKETAKKQKTNESKKQQITYKMLFEMVKNSVKSLLKEDDEIDDFGIGLDLDKTTKAYDLGNANKHWTDYSNDSDDDESGWDEDSYYNDFDDWWKSLPREEKERIYNEMK